MVVYYPTQDRDFGGQQNSRRQGFGRPDPDYPADYGYNSADYGYRGSPSSEEQYQREAEYGRSGSERYRYPQERYGAGGYGIEEGRTTGFGRSEWPDLGREGRQVQGYGGSYGNVPRGSYRGGSAMSDIEGRHGGFFNRDYGAGQENENFDYRSSASHRGRGPKGYQRSDERIQEDICERLTQDHDIDASDITVKCEGGEVTLEGTVERRGLKHRVENIVDQCAGVKDIHNHLRVATGTSAGTQTGNRQSRDELNDIASQQAARGQTGASVASSNQIRQ